MNVAFDIDGTISRRPDFFAILSRAIRSDGGKVFVVTSRSSNAEVERQTRRELRSWGVQLDELVIIPDGDRDRMPCPHAGLDWYRQYLWQKVSVCLDRDVAIVFEDDIKVVELFKVYAPHVHVFRVEQ
jgi:hypothetical protein